MPYQEGPYHEALRACMARATETNPLAYACLVLVLESNGGMDVGIADGGNPNIVQYAPDLLRIAADRIEKALKGEVANA